MACGGRGTFRGEWPLPSPQSLGRWRKRRFLHILPLKLVLKPSDTEDQAGCSEAGTPNAVLCLNLAEKGTPPGATISGTDGDRELLKHGTQALPNDKPFRERPRLTPSLGGEGE